MANANVNHVVVDGVTKLDLRSDTVDAANVIEGYTFHLADGSTATGELTHLTNAEIDAITGSSGPSINLQSKSGITPTTSSQTITADNGYDGLSSVQIDAIPSSYIIPSGSETKTANGTYDVTSLAELVVNVASPVQTATGTFTGNGTRTITFSCNFEPDIVYWNSDPGTSASSGTVAGIIVRDMMAANRYRNNSTTNSHYAIPGATGMNTAGTSYSHRATYDSTNRQVTLYCWSSNARSLFTSSRSYTVKCVKWTS